MLILLCFSSTRCGSDENFVGSHSVPAPVLNVDYAELEEFAAPPLISRSRSWAVIKMENDEEDQDPETA